MLRRFLFVALLGWLCLSVAVSGQSSRSQKEQATAKVDSSIIKVIESAVQQQGSSIQTARALGVPFDGNSVTITIVFDARQLFGQGAAQGAAAVAQAFGTSSVITAQSKTFLRLKVPINLLPLIEQLVRLVPQIAYVRPPLAPQTLAISEGVGLIGATALHDGGNLGQGTKVAVIDLGFAGLSTARARGELPGNVIVRDFTGSGAEFGTSHGTAVAEIVHDVAPNAQLYLMKVGDEVDLENAVNEAIAQGIDVINHSVGWFNTSYYDGTGVIASITQQATSAGILWVNSAGNYAQRHYKGAYRDANANGWTEFSGSDETLDIQAQAGETIHLYLTWRDWPLTGQDYDLVLVNAQNVTVATSDKTQNGGQEPTEELLYFVPGNGTYRVKVQAYSAPLPKELTLFSLNHDLEHAVAASSLVTPADVSGVLSVAAVRRENWSTGPQADYSSQGPTTDGRAKPDLSGPDNVQTSTYGAFEGTSAAAPHVAGAAALLLAQNASQSGAQLAAQLRASANPLGSPLATGAGRVALSAPPSARPDLTVLNTDFSPRSPSIGDPVQHTVTVQNRGSGAAGPFVVSLQDRIGTAQQSQGGLAAGATVQVRFTRTLTAATDTIRVTVDAGGQVAESDETNNAAQYAISGQTPPPAGQPDLVVESLDATPQQPTLNGAFQLGVRVRNQGSAAAGAFRVELQDGSSAAAQTVSGLGAGASAQLTFSATLARSGQTFTATADALGQVAESNEGNNSRALSVQASTPPPPSAPRGSIRTDSAQYQLGEALRIEFSTDARAYAYIYDVDAGGRVSQVFPSSLSPNNLLNAGAYALPDGNYRFTVTGPTGVESVHLLLSLSAVDPGVDGLNNARYTDPATFAAELEARVRARLGSSGWSTASASFQVGPSAPPANQAPRAAFTVSPANPLAGQPVSFDASGSSDADGSIVQYAWDLDGNGTTDAAGARVATTYGGAGTVTVRLTVTDDRGASDTATRTVSVGAVSVNRPPVPQFSFSPQQPAVGELVTFDAAASFDPDGTIVDYRWDLNSDGQIDVTGVRASARFNSRRDYQATLTVIDNQGASASTVQTVRVGQVQVNQPPQASFTLSPSAPQVGQAVTFDARASRDPDGSIVEYRWDFDGNGSLDALGAVVSTQFGAAGSVRVTLTVVDNGGLSHSASQTVSIAGGTPSPPSGGDPIPAGQPGVYFLSTADNEVRVVVQGNPGWASGQKYLVQLAVASPASMRLLSTDRSGIASARTTINGATALRFQGSVGDGRVEFRIRMNGFISAINFAGQLDLDGDGNTETEAVTTYFVVEDRVVQAAANSIEARAVSGALLPFTPNRIDLCTTVYRGTCTRVR